MKHLWLLLLPHMALAAQLQLSWEFDRSYVPAPDRFLITLTTPEGSDTLSVPPGASAACGPPAITPPDTFCAVVPACPTDGVVEITVQAAVADQLGPPATLGCLFAQYEPCRCIPVTLEPPPWLGTPEDGGSLPALPPLPPTTPAPPLVSLVPEPAPWAPPPRVVPV